MAAGRSGDVVEVACTCCRYPLALECESVICPECGADAARRAATSSRHTFYKNALITYVVCALPTALCAPTLLAGWFVAHFVVHIRSPHWVQNGEHASLDLLGGVWYATFAASVVTLPLAALLLPVVIVGKYRLAASRHGAQLGLFLFALLLSLPLLVAAFLCFPIPSAATPALALQLGDWIPD